MPGLHDDHLQVMAHGPIHDNDPSGISFGRARGGGGGGSLAWHRRRGLQHAGLRGSASQFGDDDGAVGPLVTEPPHVPRPLVYDTDVQSFGNCRDLTLDATEFLPTPPHTRWRTMKQERSKKSG